MYVDFYPLRRPWPILVFFVHGRVLCVDNKLPHTTVPLLITCPAGLTRLLVHIFTLDVALCWPPLCWLTNSPSSGDSHSPAYCASCWKGQVFVDGLDGNFLWQIDILPTQRSILVRHSQLRLRVVKVFWVFHKFPLFFVWVFLCVPVTI